MGAPENGSVCGVFSSNTNIRLGQKGFLGTYDPAYLASSSFRKKKSFITLTTGFDFSKLLLFIMTSHAAK
jgi:hypothetical protein